MAEGVPLDVDGPAATETRLTPLATPPEAAGGRRRDGGVVLAEQQSAAFSMAARSISIATVSLAQALVTRRGKPDGAPTVSLRPMGRGSSRDLLAAGEEALAAAGFCTGDFTEAVSLFEAALKRASVEQDRAIVARAHDGLGLVLHYANITKLMNGSVLDPADVDREAELFGTALAIQEEVGDLAGRAQSLFGVGLVAQVLRSDWAAAMPYFWEALEIADSPDCGCDLYTRSEVHRHVGFYYLVGDVQPTEAVRHLQISHDLRTKLGDARRIPSGLVALAQAELAAGNPARAVDLLREAVSQAHAAHLMPARIEDAERELAEAEASLD
ncbi:MAG: hypothetical protein ACRD0Z_10880 [Acidimicrobiales bacterium]